MMSTTIHDVAAKAGVSITTVSLVLNNKPSRVSQATKERVWAVAEELKFTNIRRSPLTGRGKGVLGIILPDIRNLFFSTLCVSAEQCAKQHGYGVLIATSEDAVESDMDYIDAMYEKGVLGIMMAKAARTTQQNEKKLQQKIIDTSLPFVTIDRHLDISNARSVMGDNKEGAALAMRHLIGLGHRRIGCITGPKQDVVSFQRMAGYKEALQEAGIAFDESLVSIGDYRSSYGAEHLPYLLGQDVTAVFCFNDMMAIGVYKACRAYGLKIPQNLSVVGYDDIAFCESLDTPLTTVHQPTEAMGEAAAMELMAMLADKPSHGPLLFRPTLKVRASTASPETT